ncbi:T9SS type A sorting domain-containing protein [Flavobacterium fluviatile]|uniref:T9SS type A sorting domain-containing protein n=1 Tax=Flavobacterium fluviatile TaxID=1862387 RepID=UPI0013D2BF00|nr:T9SS type A sorting domain-containing protein [Flavobacterium fluviatile]
MKWKTKMRITVFLVLILSLPSIAQSLQHPTIYATAAERPQILSKISSNSWANSMVNSMKSNVDSKITTHSTNPAAIFSTVDFFPANDANSEAYASPYTSAHGKVLSTAAYSAMLYYITEDVKYASFSADILNYYFDNLSNRTLATTTISGNYFYDPRTTYAQLAVAYDFVYNYLKTPGITVYNKATNTRVPYDHTRAQTVIRNIAGNTLKESGGLDTQGSIVSNHPVLTAPGSLFSILCVEDDIERERMFTLFWDRGTKRQNSFTKTILKMFTEQALWPESVSYGFMSNVQLILNLVDRVKPQLNAGANNIKLFESASLLENLRLPNRNFVRYGDSHRTSDGTDEISRYALNFAKRRGYTNIQTQAEIALKQSFPTTNGYNTSVPATGFENYVALDLFWGEPLPNTSVVAFDYKPTVIINHAGVALQRNYVTTNNTEYGLCGIIGGAHYVHAHCAGISMELYGAGDVMAANGGLPPSLAERQTLPFQGYFNKYAGNNTVIVNGTSHGASKAGAWGNDKFLYQDPVVNIASEPKHLENPLSANFSFATQFMDDNVNNCDQQRTLSTIRTSATSGYYFDLFRSKSLGTNNFHDYIYHNVGDATSLKDASNNTLVVRPTTKYQVVVNDSQQSPGWLQYENTESTVGINDAVKIRFDLTTTNKYMHMLLPAGVTREYTKALGPATYEANNGYVSKKTQIIAVRQTGEAWNKPFISILEPSSNATATVQSVENVTVNNIIVGAIVKSKLADRETTDYIICNENNTGDISLPQLNLTFKGRFAIVRTEVKTDKKDITLYIGEGTQLNFEKYALTGDIDKKGLLEVKDVSLAVSSFDKSNRIEIFPNPAKGVFKIQTNELIWKKLTIYDMQGKKVYQNTSGQATLLLNTEEHKLKAGVYIVEFVDNQNKRCSSKLVVK